MPGEIVKLHNWGSDDRLIGFGKFDWDEEDRSFSLSIDNEMTISAGLQPLSIDRYDSWRTCPEKLFTVGTKVQATEGSFSGKTGIITNSQFAVSEAVVDFNGRTRKMSFDALIIKN